MCKADCRQGFAGCVRCVTLQNPVTICSPVLARWRSNVHLAWLTAPRLAHQTPGSASGPCCGVSRAAGVAGCHLPQPLDASGRSSCGPPRRRGAVFRLGARGAVPGLRQGAGGGALGWRDVSGVVGLYACQLGGAPATSEAAPSPGPMVEARLNAMRAQKNEPRRRPRMRPSASSGGRRRTRHAW